MALKTFDSKRMFEARAPSNPALHMLRTDAFESPERSIYLPTVHPRVQLPQSHEV